MKAKETTASEYMNVRS